MNVLKNLSAVFVVALDMAVSASYVTPAPGESADPAQPQSASIATPGKMAVVTVSAKRMSAAEKQRSLEAERLARQGSAPGNRI
jgi:hypothetical protein